MRYGPKPQDLTGLVFNRWKVLGFDRRVSSGHRKWFCRCVCGMEKSVYGHFLKSGVSKSCGCLKRELSAVICREKFDDLTGMRFGHLLVLSRSRNARGRTMWNVICDCGVHISVRSDSLKSGNTKSCGCEKIRKAANQGASNVFSLVGLRFGRLAVLRRDVDGKHASPRKAYWLCQCDCGNQTVVVGSSLTCGTTRSCGCYKSDITRERMTNHALTEEERLLGHNRSLIVGHVEWRRSVYERDHYTCCVCGDSRGGNLVAHHKDGWEWCKERRLDEDNGVTACEDCHKEFHHAYGWGGNTEKQWRKFVASRREKEAVA